MFKLVAVGGEFRGEEYELNDGENIIGRSPESDISLNIKGISKQHFKINVNNDHVFLEDLGSINGTIVNGKMVKVSSLNNGDVIAIPNLILKIVHVEEKKIIVKRKVLKESQNDDHDYDNIESEEPMPSSLFARPIWLFKYKLMPIFYGINKQYEWSFLVGFLIVIFVTVNVSLTILPVLQDSRDLLFREIILRAKQYASEVDRTNKINLRDRNLDLLNTSFLESGNVEGVQGYKLFDVDGRIFRPVSQKNTIVNDSFSVEAINFFKIERNQNLEYAEKEGNVIKIARAIKTYDTKLGREVVVAIISLFFSPGSLIKEASNNSKAYLESLMTSLIVAVLFFGIIYFLTNKILVDLKNQIELVLRGRQSEVETRFLFQEMIPLKNSINGLLTRLREFQSAASGEDFQTIEEEGPYLRILEEFLAGSQGPVLILDSEKKVYRINPEGEDLMGFRENSSVGENILDVTREQGIAATIIELCDNSANNSGLNQEDAYEIGGGNFSIHVTALIGKDNFAKCFYITFVRND